MYIQKFKFIVSACIAIFTIGIFGAHQYQSVQRMVAIRGESTTTTQTVATDNSPPQPQTSQAEPETKNPIEASAPKPTQDSATQKLLARLNYTDEITEQSYYALATTPNDTIYPQWYTTIIDAPDAWDITRGSSETTVAVIDTGFALEHDDLNAAWLINDGEQGMTSLSDLCWNGVSEDKQTNACDDDENGLIDDWRGWDFANADNSPLSGQGDDVGSTHGTKVAGLVGARSNNGAGVAALNWETKILPLQGLFDEGVGYSSDIAAAIVYAVERGADVVNLSLGGSSPDTLILAAIQYADANNVVVVAASGNCGDEQSSPECTGYPSPGGMSYPARYSEAIAVGATDSNDELASFSSWGAELDIVAPGSGTIRTPTWSSGNETSLYSDTSYGTSFAAPIVSGLVALLKSEFPEVDIDDVIALLKGGADKPAGMNGSSRTDLYGYGRINAHSTLLEINDYQQDLLKGDMRGALLQTSEQSPLITTNSGHSTETAITTSTEVITYCVTTPSTLCTLNFNKDGSSQVSLGSKLANAQGIATWRWTADDISESGTWSATTTSNLLTSQVEQLIIQ